MPLGLYISVPFCRSKCSYCNFASDVFSSALFRRYIDRLCADIARSDDIARLRATGIDNTNIDLIAGLPHQTLESWNLSLSHVIDSGVPHVSVYMLEIDEDSRLGRELIAGGTRYHAHFVPDEDVTADL